MRETGDLPAATLEPWLAAHVEGYGGPSHIAKFPGGQSNPTYRLTTPGGDYVLRRKPFGDLLPSAHAVEREFRLLHALQGTDVPTPKVHALCEDASVIGSVFYVMQYLDGRTFWDGGLPDRTPEQRTVIYNGLIDTLAALHRVDPTAVGLGDYGKPGNYFARQVERWTRQYRASETETIPAMERLIEFLPKTLPPQTHVSIVHGDYRIDNVVYDTDGAKVIGVLDWELSTLGDPLADFAYLAMNWIQPAEGRAGISGLDHAALGIPTLDAVVERYCRATGRDGIPALDWYFAFNLFRIAGILQGVRKRALMGNASSAEAERVSSRVSALAERGWGFAQI